MSEPKSDRVSASRSATEGRGETFYPGPSRTPLGAYPPRERWDDWVELDSRAWPRRVERHYMLVPTTCFNCESACGLLAYVDRETLEIRKFEGNPEHPGSRGRNCAKGPATLNQINDPDRILYPLKRGGQARREPLGARVAGTRRSTTSPGASGRRIVEERPQRRHVPRRPPRRGRLHRARARGLGRRRPQLAHQHLLARAAAPATSSGWASTGRAPTTPTPNVILLISAHLESGHYFNPHAQRVMDGKARGRQARSCFDVRLSNTATHADHWLAPCPGQRGRDPARDRQPPDPGRTATTASSCGAGGTGRSTWRPSGRASPRRFESFETALERLYAEYTLRLRRSASPASTPPCSSEVARLVADGRHAAHHAQLAERGRRQPGRLAGLAHALPAERAAWARSPCRAASSRTPGTSSCRGRSTRRRTRRSGTSSPGRRSTRSR